MHLLCCFFGVPTMQDVYLENEIEQKVENPALVLRIQNLQGITVNPWSFYISNFREPLVMIPSRLFGPILVCYHFTPGRWIIGNLCATFSKPIPDAIPQMIHVVGNRPISGWRRAFKSMRFLPVI
jgi:hypothetical protein